MLAEYSWTESTRKNLVSQLRKWLMFCEDEGRSALPASEGDVLAFIGYLSLEGRVGPRSARQYVTSVSRYHEDAGYMSPTKTRLVTALLKAYEKKVDNTAGVSNHRAGLEAGLLRRVVSLGFQTSKLPTLCACSMLVFELIFQARSVTVDHVAPENVEFSQDKSLSVRLVYRKAKRTARPLLLRYPYSPSWTPGYGPNDLLRRWNELRPGGRGYSISARRVSLGRQA